MSLRREAAEIRAALQLSTQEMAAVEYNQPFTLSSATTIDSRDLELRPAIPGDIHAECESFTFPLINMSLKHIALLTLTRALQMVVRNVPPCTAASPPIVSRNMLPGRGQSFVQQQPTRSSSSAVFLGSLTPYQHARRNHGPYQPAHHYAYLTSIDVPRSSLAR